MFRSKIATLTVLFLWATASDAKFPNDPKPCPYGDSECIKKMITFVFTENPEGYAPLNVVSLKPLRISEIDIKQGESSPVSVDLKFKNSELRGVETARVVNVKGFGKDLTQPHELQMEADWVTLLSDYTVNGKVLILPISGSGKSNITLDNLKLKMTIHGEPLVKNGETYMNVKKLTLNIDTTRMHSQFENLFNGDKTLGDNMNLFLNENWKDIYGEVRESLTTAFASIFQSVINNVFQKYPYAKLFASE